MNIISTPVLPELSATESQPVAGGPPLAKDGAAANAAQASFPAVLTRANQQSAPPKTVASVKEQSENATLSSFTQGEAENVGAIASEVTEEPQSMFLAPLNLQPVQVAGVPLSPENTLVLALASNAQGNLTAASASPLAAPPEVSGLVEDETGSIATTRGVSISSPTLSAKGSIPGESQALVLPTASPASVPVSGHIRPDVSIGTPSGHKGSSHVSIETFSGHEDTPLVLAREQSLPLQSGNRLPLPSVPLSFVNGGFQQGQVVSDPVSTTTLSTTVPQNVQGTLASSSGTPAATVQESIGNTQLSGVGQGDDEGTGGHLGSEQRSSQENAGAFSNKQQASGHTLGGFSIATDSGSEFRVSESSSSSRADALVDRSRTMNMLSPQRLQMEVMLADDTKVQVDVAVTQQQVSAQLMTDQLMLRNLALQHEPQLDAQLASAGLELKQFGAEVSEEGLFGQHLSDSSSQDSHSRGGNEVQVSQESEILVGAGAGDDGRFHYVA